MLMVHDSGFRLLPTNLPPSCSASDVGLGSAPVRPSLAATGSVGLIETSFLLVLAIRPRRVQVKWSCCVL